MQNEIRKPENKQIPSLGRAASNKTFHNALERFFDADDAAGHVSVVNRLCHAFTRYEIEYPMTRHIADMVMEVDALRDFIVNVESAYLDVNVTMTVAQASAISDLLSPTGSEPLIHLLKSALQDWILSNEDDEYYDEVLEESLTNFKTIIDLINLCYAIYKHADTLKVQEGGASWEH